ncbi:protein kinase C and casein kinase II substrate protein 3-like [Sinocyclocheilus rhinocerous]|uniref:protein kinase C and casein kinase II substrate protein 3-like n=1 Tax=Sinocyclocheilus rhinocerous TaxID=307959 RepID=UPI0007B84435|nr:PREDICTED: protein kinase C and casein kinase II substrate protein 3-like [Sinocyclocheilus rhinocerous]
MSMNWPQFEEWSPEANRSISRRERNSHSDDVVTLTNIVSAGDEPPKTPQETTRWLEADGYYENLSGYAPGVSVQLFFS